MIRRLFLLYTLFMITACASVPMAIEGDNFQTQLTPSTVSSEPSQHIGTSVRWGGVIVEVVNNDQETWVEILALPLSDSAKPYGERTGSLGRFIAKTNDFLDPEVYQKGLKFTVTGQVSETIQGKVGERDYTYATVDVKSHYLWPRVNMYRSYYVTPGYWFYGFHPYWRFGYPYFGYGVWSYHNYYHPYYPVYGYLSRSESKPHHQYRSGDFAYARMLAWDRRQQEWALRNTSYQRYPGASRSTYRGSANGQQMVTSRSSGVQSTNSSASSSNRSVSRSKPRSSSSRAPVTRRSKSSPIQQQK
ncbi:MAG: Slp family lipoprotein [Gammaproteobacteria bacterium]